MKATLNWLGDPCLHLALVALFVFRLFLGSGGDEEPTDSRRPAYMCYVCGKSHEADDLCPDRGARTGSMVVSH